MGKRLLQVSAAMVRKAAVFAGLKEVRLDDCARCGGINKFTVVQEAREVKGVGVVEDHQVFFLCEHDPAVCWASAYEERISWQDVADHINRLPTWGEAWGLPLFGPVTTLETVE